MSTSPLISKAAVTGANGFVGRWLITELTRQGTHVAAFVRHAELRAPELGRWLAAHGGDEALLTVYRFDLQEDDLALDTAGRAALLTAQVVYHLAANFGFGLDPSEARQTNVTAAVKLVELCRDAAHLTRFVHISGYRTEGVAAQALDIDDDIALDRFYTQHGAYEASKMEAHERVRRAAATAGVPLTRVSPGLVIGDSKTGETTQITGLAETLQKLWQRCLPALVGKADTWMPVVTVDFLASVLVAIPSDSGVSNEHLIVLDDRTPPLPQLIEHFARRFAVKSPTLLLPVQLMQNLPSSVTGVDREALSFVSSDRYDTHLLNAFVTRNGLQVPDLRPSLDRYADFLLDTRFCERKPRGGHIFQAAGVPVFARGDRTKADVVLLHGLMLNEHTWTPVTDRLHSAFLAPDLPGLGRSPAGGTPSTWLAGVLAPSAVQPVLVGHSLGAAFAVEYAARYPERVRSLVLISPFFLQSRPGWALRQKCLMTNVFRHAGSKRLASILGEHDTVEDAVNLLGRRDVAQRSAAWLAWAAQSETRTHLRDLMASAPVPIHVVVGEHDPLVVPAPTNVFIHRVSGAGHYPQLSQPKDVVRIIQTALTT